MLAAVTKSPGVMVLDDVAEPGPPGPEDVILRPEVVGICGSDLHMYSGEVGALSGARSFFPRIQGHELCAVIAETGADSGVVKVLITVNDHNGNGGIRHE